MTPTTAAAGPASGAPVLSPCPRAAAEEREARLVFDASALGREGVAAVAADLRRAGFLTDRRGAGRRR
ncbi:MAG: hypothetical protein PGN34_08535 [Methylobacterium frigidaeris]